MQKVDVLDQGVVISEPHHVFGYYAWPTVALDMNGDLIVTCSGKRTMHVCPFGKVVMLKSTDQGRSWSKPAIIVDTPLDDRDAGIVHLGAGQMVVSTFNNSIAQQYKWAESYRFGHRTPAQNKLAVAYLDNLEQKDEDQYLGSLLTVSQDNGLTWQEPFHAPVSAPHGPNKLSSGGIIYAGTPIPHLPEGSAYPIAVYRSQDLKQFELLARIPACIEASQAYHNESHIIELPSGRLVLQVRLDERGRPYEERLFTIAQSISDDAGKTWSPLSLTGAAGAPPHLLYLSSGVLLSVYGRRKPPYGIQAMISHDEGDSWELDLTVWAQGLDSDLGYPSSVQLPNGEIFTVFYAIRPGEKHCSVLWIRWRLKEND